LGGGGGTRGHFIPPPQVSVHDGVSCKNGTTGKSWNGVVTRPPEQTREEVHVDSERGRELEKAEADGRAAKQPVILRQTLSEADNTTSWRHSCPKTSTTVPDGFYLGEQMEQLDMGLSASHCINRHAGRQAAELGVFANETCRCSTKPRKNEPTHTHTTQVRLRCVGAHQMMMDRVW
jgi:hypothetical protein